MPDKPAADSAAEQTPDAIRRQRLARYRAIRRRASPRESEEAFEDLVARALDRLPRAFRDRMDNVAVIVEERPDPEHMRSLGFSPHQQLLGLYEGINHLQRGSGYNFAVPDRITLYRQPILAQAAMGGPDAVERQVWKTVVHEVAHHFGIGDAELEHLERSAYGP